MVDDEVDVLDVSKGLLDGMGDLRVETCISAKEALALLQTRQFDVIVSDYQMPGMNGIDFLKIHRGRGDLTPFILFTGKGNEEVAVQGINNGADFYLQKGEDYRGQFAELVNMMKLAVQRRRSDQALRESEERYRHSEEKFMTCSIQPLIAFSSTISKATYSRSTLPPSELWATPEMSC